MKKTMKKVTAVTLAAAMALAVPFTAAADGGSGAGSGTSSGTIASTNAASASVYFKENVTTVVVPTKLTVAFNPNNLDIMIDGVANTNDIVSRPVAIVSEATKDKKVAVSFAVTSTNSAVKFVDTPAAANTGTDLNVCLQLVAATGGISIPGSGTTSGTTIAVNSGTRSYEPASLAKATMTAAGSGTSGTVTIKNGSAVGFKLDKASYDYTSIDLDTGSGATNNKISGTLSGLGTTGYSAFNLTGYLNDNADWYDVGDSTSITITPTYTISDAASTDTAITNTVGFLGATTASSSAATDDYVMTLANGAATYTFVNAPEGSLTAAVVDGTARNGAVTQGNIAYADGVVTINSTAVNGFNLSTGAHTIKLTIGGTEYTFTLGE